MQTAATIPIHLRGIQQDAGSPRGCAASDADGPAGGRFFEVGTRMDRLQLPELLLLETGVLIFEDGVAAPGACNDERRNGAGTGGVCGRTRPRAEKMTY